MVTEVTNTPHASAHLVRGNEVIRLSPGRNVVGRRHASEVALEDASVSRTHAAITIDGSGITIEDLASRNGTYVDGQRIDQPFALGERHVLTFGDVAAIFTRTDDDAPTGSLHPCQTDTAKRRAVAAALSGTPPVRR